MPCHHPCTFTLDDGTHYDLSSLASASADYETIVNGTSYKLNVCRGVVSELWKLDDPDTIGGFVKKDGGDFSLGRVNTTMHVSPATNEPMLYLQNGSPCPSNPDEFASTAVRFICSKADFDAGSPSLIAALPPLDSENSCHFFFEWRTHVACKTVRRAELQSHHYLGFGAIVFLILAWFIGHTAYNRFILQKRGTDVFPIPRIKPQMPSLPSLGRSAGSNSKPRWGLGRRSQRGYSNVRADENDENEGFAGRFSLDDDDEGDVGGTGGDARELGGDTEAWRGARSGAGAGVPNGGPGGKPGAHQGLVDV